LSCHFGTGFWWGFSTPIVIYLIFRYYIASNTTGSESRALLIGENGRNYEMSHLNVNMPVRAQVARFQPLNVRPF